jgi:hypothetical protein
MGRHVARSALKTESLKRNAYGARSSLGLAWTGSGILLGTNRGFRLSNKRKANRLLGRHLGHRDVTVLDRPVH